MKILEAVFVASLVFTFSFSQNDICIGLPPSIIRGPPKNLIYRNGGNVSLECKGKGVPDVTYEWKKNGFIFNQSVHIVHTGSDGTITIQPATSVDEGFYQCFVRNQYGTALSNTTHLQMAFLESTSGTPVVLDKNVSGGMSFTIQCDRLRSFPKPTYIWEIVNSTDDENPIPFVPTKLTLIAENGDLNFSYALPKDDLDGKLYRCSTYNPYLNITEGGNYTRLTVITGNFIELPKYCGYATDPVVGLIGGSVAIQCLFYKSPENQSTIFWSKPEPPGSTLPIGRYTLNDFNTTLTINNITASDEGIYRCVAGCWMNITMRVGAVPIFPTVNDAPYDVNVTEGNSFTFKCNATAKPEAKIVWLQDGKELDLNNPPARFVFSKDLKNLTIRDVCRDCVDRERKTDLMVIQCNASNVHGYAFAQGYLNVLFSERYCRSEIDKEHSILWTRTSVGEEISQPCSGNTTGWCSRKCLLGKDDSIARWSRPNCNGCFDNEFSELLEKTFCRRTQARDLKTGKVEETALENQSVIVKIASQLLAVTFCRRTQASDLKTGKVEETALENQSVIVKIAGQLSAVTNKSLGLSPGNLNASVMIINGLGVLRSNSTVTASEKEIKVLLTNSIVQAASNVLQPNNFKAWKELEKVNKIIATSILLSLDVYGRSLSTLNVSENSTEEEDNVVLDAWSFEKSNLPLQIEFPGRSVWGENREDGISISTEALDSSASSENQSTLKMWGVYYRTVNDYLPGNKDIDVVNSRILSFSIDGLKTNETLKRPVLITLRHNQEKSLKFQRTCAFWNFDRGEWDSKGCSVISTNSTHTICSCDHLTNFAILMSRNPSEDKLLSLISIIGCSISVAALILTIIVYTLTWKHSKSSRATILLNLCVTLIIAYIVFLAGADKVDSKVGCKAVAVLLHYFFLAAFFIMLAEGVEMVLYMFFVFHVRRTRETIMLVATAWVLPLIIVGVSLGYTKLEGYGHDKSCWLSLENHLFWAFVGPILCIITVNFVIVIVVLRLVSQKRALLAKDSKKRDDIRATLWNLSVTCPVLGLGWLFGVLSISFDHVVFQYLFAVANSLQGLLIFIFHGLIHNKKMNENISSMYSNYICRCRKSDTKIASTQEQSTNSIGGTQMTSNQEQSTSSRTDYDPRAATQMTSAQ